MERALALLTTPEPEALSQALLRECREAIEPFAKTADNYPRSMGWHPDHVITKYGITLTDVRRAAKLLPKLSSALAQQQGRVEAADVH